MRTFNITVTERIQKVYEVEARNGTEAAIAVSKLRDAGTEPKSTTVLDSRLSAPRVSPVDVPQLDETASAPAEPEKNAAGSVK